MTPARRILSTMVLNNGRDVSRLDTVWSPPPAMAFSLIPPGYIVISLNVSNSFGICHSRTGPLGQTQSSGLPEMQSCEKESSTDSGAALGLRRWGRAAESWWDDHAFHVTSVSNSIKRHVRRYSLEPMWQLRKSPKSVEKSVIHVKRRPDKNGRHCTIAQNCVMHSRSVDPRREYVRDHLWLTSAITRSEPSFS